MVLFQAEFSSDDRNPNINGTARALVVTQEYEGGPVRMVITGAQGTGLHTRAAVVSDATISAETWATHRDVIIGSLQD